MYTLSLPLPPPLPLSLPAQVVQYTFSEARLGRTPNPDVMCNSRIKFGMFYQHVGRHFAKVATGHYAQVRKNLCLARRLSFFKKISPIFLYA